MAGGPFNEGLMDCRNNHDDKNVMDCRVPYWWKQKEEYVKEGYDPDACTKGVEGFFPGMTIIPFSCDPVGSLMGRAWRMD